MMVWLYELKADGAPDYVMLAAMTLSSLPLLIIFLFAQRTIMRGIILPSFK
jgi:multiple sugar transport system permease protein